LPFHHQPAVEKPAPAPSETSSEPTAAASEPQTVLDEVTAPPTAITDTGTTTVITDVGPELKATAPKSYAVKRGDTLWGIATMFLRDPLTWPEIWYVNPQIENPHRIYPGDTVRLALGTDGHTQLQVVRRAVVNMGGPAVRLEPLLRSSPLDGPIASIPYSVIASFLTHPGVLTREQVKSAPYVLAPRDHDIAGSGDEVYVKHLASSNTGLRYNVMHVDQPLVDPDSGHRLGYLAVYTGTAQLTRPGKVAKATLTDSARETLGGDVLIVEDRNPSLDFVPHAPAHPIAGRVIGVVNNVLLAGQYDVVALNRGASDGLERGNVLTVDADPKFAIDRCPSIEGHQSCSWWDHSALHTHSDALGSEPEGSLLVFKTYQHMSYALVLNESAPIHVEDHVRNP
jgi:hypothetical protein